MIWWPSPRHAISISMAFAYVDTGMFARVCGGLQEEQTACTGASSPGSNHRNACSGTKSTGDRHNCDGNTSRINVGYSRIDTATGEASGGTAQEDEHSPPLGFNYG